MEEIEYGKWYIHPKILTIGELVPAADAIFRKMATKHEGEVLYVKYWNFWIRVGATGNSGSKLFFPDYEKSDKNTDKLFSDMGIPSSYPKSERDIWDRIAGLWSWLAAHGRYDVAEYGNILSNKKNWPSIPDYAKYYAAKGGLVWAACFSVAHLFASLMGRIIPVRQRFLISEAHHTESGAPPTATHVYLAVYVTDRWFYLDPTAISYITFPSFSSRQSVGMAAFTSVDYEHPYNTIRLPGSSFEFIPYLPV